MELSNSGKVVIIDDKYAEAKPLIKIFGEKNVPYLYYGSSSDLPEKPLNAIRYIFLDIQLVSTHDNKTMASSICGIMDKLVSKDNGHFVIIFWTKHNEVIDMVLENLRTINIIPINYLNLEKGEYIKYFNGESAFDYDNLIKKLDTELNKIPAFQLYIDWENMLNNAGIKHISEFSGLFPFNDKWSKNTENLFYKLYKSVVEKSETTDDKKINIAFSLLNQSFMNSLQNETNLYENNEFKLNGSELSKEISAKINTSLLLTFNSVQSVEPGDCYLFEDNKDELEHFINSSEKVIKYNNTQNAKLCKIIITPSCDIAQKKLINHRFLSGIIIDDDAIDSKKSRDDYYCIGPFILDTKIKFLILNFQTFSSVKPEKIDFSKRLFTLKTAILNDIQSKAANHVNRIGIIKLD